MARHGRDSFYVVGEGILTPDVTGEKSALGVATAPQPRLSEAVELRQFRFSRIGPQGTPASNQLVTELAGAITDTAPDQDGDIPSGYTYLGQFVDHDLTMDKSGSAFGSDITVDELVQGRSPALDLDSLYGRGPAEQPQFYTNGLHIKMGSTAAGSGLPAFDGFDLPRDVSQTTALIPEARNDENLVVAQTHLAFIRFHNRVVDVTPPG
ncbi:MAG: hypothetical protein QOD39_1204, partial [Mycobacterium sp.]|nr:hypothetical protein [Mycobacterium sp.]